MNLEKLYNSRIIVLFIILQPILDVLTYLTNNLFGFSIGIIIRGLFLFYEVLYLLFFDKSNRKYNYLLFALLFVFIIIQYIFSYSSLTNLMLNLSSVIKFLYFPITILFFYKINVDGLSKKVTICGVIIALLMFLAQILGGAILSYESAKLGNSGWFFSANELSSMCAILIPIVYSYFINSKNKYGFFTFILLSFSMLLIGTKTAYLAIGITLLIFLIYFPVGMLLKKINLKKEFLITLILFVIFIVITPVTYAYKNIYILDQNIPIKDIMLSGRDQIKENNLNEKNNNNFSKDENTYNIYYEFERDYYNIYYNFGVHGCITFFIVPLVLVILNWNIVFNNIKNGLSIDKLGALISLILAFSIAYISGHILLSPAVSIYICLIFSIFLKTENTTDKKNVMFISSVGGHLTQLLELKQIFNDYNYTLVTEKTSVTEKLKEKYNVDYLLYGSRKYIIKYIFIAITNCIKSIYMFEKYSPDVIVTTGTHTAVPMCYIGWFVGKKVIYIESFAKSTSPTLTGRIVYPIATTFVVQWDSMKKFYPKAEYWGGIY